MKIYTKTGDKGETGLFGAKRVSKDSKRIDAYGTVDELNSVIGVARSLGPPPDIALVLQEIQSGLFVLGSDLATPAESSKPVPRIRPSDVTQVEKHIDTVDARLEPLGNFVLPAGTQLAAMLHLARTVCRRAERRVVKLAKKEELGEVPVMFLNRLADLLFVLARYANHLAGQKEEKWVGKKESSGRRRL